MWTTFCSIFARQIHINRNSAWKSLPNFSLYFSLFCLFLTVKWISRPNCFITSMQIGNCVGAANHRHFIAFLISAIISTIYVSFMSTYAGLYTWPPLSYRSLGQARGYSMETALRALKEVVFALLRSAVLLSARGLVLVYLFIASVSVEIGLSVLLWQQLSYIYEGKTYLSHLNSHEGDEVVEKGYQNLARFFGCPYSLSRYLPSFQKKRHEKWKKK